MVIHMPSCGGCRTCEMACSFRHRRVFIPSISSIHIIERESGPGFLVSLIEKDEGERIACDGCTDFVVPECVRHCEKGDDLEKIVRDFVTTLRK